VSARACSFPCSVTLLFAYPATTALPSDVFLSERISELQAHFPLLHARVVDASTSAPYWALRDRTWTAAEVLRHEAYEEIGDVKREQACILHAEVDRMEQQDFDTTPLWSVTILTCTGSTRAYLAVSVQHEIADGMGLLALAHALLAPSIDDLPYEALDKIPSHEDTVPCGPSIRQLLALVWCEVLVPALPAFLQPYLRPPRTWPATDIAAAPKDCPWGISILALSPVLLDGLKAARSAHGVRALHTTLQLAYAIAVWHVLTPTREGLPMTLGTLKSERRADLGHAHCTGNYVASLELDLRPRADDAFWPVAARLYASLRSASELTLARGRTGIIAYIPHPWAPVFAASAARPAPFINSVSVSNLGRTALPAGAVDAVWTVDPSPLGPAPLAANVLGHEGGIRVATVWREGSVAQREEVLQVEQVFERILRRLGDADWKGLTFRELVEFEERKGG
jgi:hypothetical protein